MQRDPLTPSQREFLEKLRSQETGKDFYLAGGSGLALHLQHRQSLDHDFFTQKFFLPTDLQKELSEIFGPVVPLQIEKGTLSIQAGDTKASFFHYSYPLLRPLEMVQDLFPTASLLDIALMKLTAIADRGLRKDFVDLYAILQAGISLEEIIQSLPAKFPGTNYQMYHFLKALTYFEDAKAEPLHLLKRVDDWGKIQAFFRNQVAKISP